MDGGADAKQGGQARCILWRPKGTAVPRPLADALTRPDFQVTECDNEFEAVARLCNGVAQRQSTVLLLLEPKRLAGLADVGEVIDRYAPGATLWLFEQEPTPQIRAVTAADRAEWEGDEPESRPEIRVVGKAVGTEAPPVRKAGPVLSPATGRIADDAVSSTRVKMPQAPRLRLAGEGPGKGPVQASAMGAEVKVRAAEVGAVVRGSEPSVAKPEMGLEEGPGIPAGPSGKAGNLLTDEELEMLLAPDPDKGQY